MIVTILIYVGTIVLTLFLARVVPSVNFEKGKYLSSSIKSLLNSVVIAYPLFLLLGARYNIGTDYENYEKLYEFYRDSGITTFEPFFAGLFWMWDKSNWSFDNFIIFTSLLSVIIPLGYIKNAFPQKDTFLAIFTLIVFLFGSWFNIIRQCVAMGIILIAIHYLIERKLLLYVIFVLLASLCHSSALLLLPCALLINFFKTSFSRKKLICKLLLFSVLCLILVFLYLRFGAGLAYYDHVMGEHEDGISSKWFIIFSCLLYYPEMMFLKYIIKEDNKYIILYALLILEITCYIFGLYMNLGYRIGQLFALAHVYLLPRIVRCAKLYHKSYIKPYIYLILIAFFYFTSFIAKYNEMYNYQYKLTNLYKLLPFL